MGRIAEALKRAQQERARRASEASQAGEGQTVAAVASSETDAAPEAAAGDYSNVAMISPPPFQAFNVTTPPIPPERVAPHVVAFHDPASAIAERYRSARTRLLTANSTGGTRVFAVTSSLPREGKTVTTANMGFSFAELKHLRVAMIDCDLRGRGLSKLFGAEHEPGLAEVIRGEKTLAEVCLPVVRNNLYLIPRGDIQGASPSDLLSGNAAVFTFREIGERFHYGLIDAPAVNTVADIGLIAPLCHSVVMVIRMGKTPEPLLVRSVRMLQANRVSISGAILAGYCEKTMQYTDSHDYYESNSNRWEG